MTVSSTPEGVSVQPRHLHFDVSEDLKVFWHGGDAFRTAFFNALSLQFPDGEQQFINRGFGEATLGSSQQCSFCRKIHRFLADEDRQKETERCPAYLR